MTKGVMRPGHVQIRVLDLDEAVVHYRDRLGMIEVGRDSQNRAYFKGWTEIDAFSVVLREADEPGMDFMGFKVTDAAFTYVAMDSNGNKQRIQRNCTC